MAFDPFSVPETPFTKSLRAVMEHGRPRGGFTVASAVYWNSVNQSPPPMTAGDRIVFTSQQQINLQGVIPAGAAEGQVGYVVNLQNGNGLTGA